MTRLRMCAAGFAIAAATMTTACAPITVTSFTGRGVDVTAYRTFAWERLDTAVPGDPRLDNNPFFHEYLRDAVEGQLLSRGYQHTSVGPEVYVHYHVTAQQKVAASGPERGIERCLDCTVEVYDEGTLLVDLTDARSGALLWRGVAESGLPVVVNSQPRMEATINRVVERIFAKLRRRL